MLKEFDRNTAEHIIGQKRKIEDEGETNKTAENIIVKEEDRELQDKRMKIEYIRNLLPSSFGNIFIFHYICIYLCILLR